MDGRRSGRGRGRGVRQPQAHRDDQGSAIGPNQGQINKVDNQVATAINHITDILERLVECQGPGPINQPGAEERGKDRALERLLKFAPLTFLGGPDPDVAENCLERMTNIFAPLDYTDERRVNFAAF